jgi:hypothetical protein
MKWCVPSALQILTGKSYEECEILLRKYLGDQPIQGVFITIASRILRDLGYNVEPWNIKHAITLSKLQGIHGTYLVETRGHAQIIIDGLLYDNSHNGVSLKNNKTKIERVYEVSK